MGYEEFATTKIIVPDGPFAGERLNLSRQPWNRHAYKAMDSGKYLEFILKKPTQAGGTFTFVVVPLAKHLCHDRHTNVFGLPDTNMASDKWSIDIKPVILKTEYADQLPKKGPGSQGGMPPTISLDGGGVIRFMCSGGGGGQRIGFTGRNLFVSEANKLDAPGKLSVVTDAFSELKGRLSAYLASKQYRIFAECIPTVPNGIISVQYDGGSQSYLEPKCQHCGEYVYIDRENFFGWQEATCVQQARELGRFVCPKCGSIWSERDRRNAVMDARLIDLVDSIRFSYRVNAAHNFFVNQEDIAEAEYRALQNPDSESAERNMCQDWWAREYVPALAKDPLPVEILSQRANGHPRFVILPSHDVKVGGVDVGQDFLHAAYGGFARNPFSGVIVDYGRTHTQQDSLGVDNGIIHACEEIERHRREMGIELMLIDEGWQTELIRKIALRFGWYPARGFGANQRDAGVKLYEPRAKGGECVWVGDRCHGVQLTDGTIVVHHDADSGKAWIQHRLQTPSDQPGCLSIFGDPDDHKDFFRQITAEQYKDVKGKFQWVKIPGRPNHYLDASVLMGCAARMLEANILTEERERSRRPRQEHRQQQRLPQINRSPIRSRY